MLSIGQIGVHARSPPSCEPRCSFLILVLPLVVSASARRLRSAAAKSAVTSTLQCGQANGAWSLISCPGDLYQLVLTFSRVFTEVRMSQNARERG